MIYWKSNFIKSKEQIKHGLNVAVNLYIQKHIKLIYFITFICGSSFSAVSLCNSYLFQLDTFSMGLSRKQMAIFRNKRIFSVVLLEVE